MMQRLQGKIAVVTGASRGAGRGIALVLGEEGATVYVTGRSVRGGPTTHDWPETIDETAEMVTARGGAGIPVRCDHTVDEQVEALFERVKREHGRLDILVNNAWGGADVPAGDGLFAEFWKQPLARWDSMLMAGVRSHMTTSYFAVPLMLPHRRGLIANTSFLFTEYFGTVFIDVAVAAMNRMAVGMAHELRPHKIAAVALSPGHIRTENMLRAYGTDEENWHKVPHLKDSESPQYVGRAVAALASDPQVMRHSGKTLTVSELAREYGFTDIDGRQP
jgi:NAD(P)-dependent dehydrogenase (short-subunit alcohol dehydrogenase family)